MGFNKRYIDKERIVSTFSHNWDIWVKRFIWIIRWINWIRKSRCNNNPR